MAWLTLTAGGGAAGCRALFCTAFCCPRWMRSHLPVTLPHYLYRVVQYIENSMEAGIAVKILLFNFALQNLRKNDFNSFGP